jgi:hypothetical protein
LAFKLEQSKQRIKFPSQIEEGLEGANHSGCAFKFEPSKHRVKVACLLKSQIAHSENQIEEGFEGANRAD